MTKTIGVPLAEATLTELEDLSRAMGRPLAATVRLLLDEALAARNGRATRPDLLRPGRPVDRSLIEDQEARRAAETVRIRRLTGWAG